MITMETSRCAGAGLGIALLAVLLAVFLAGNATPAVLPDLTDGGGGSFSPTGISANQTFKAQVRVLNNGSACGAFWVRFYASTDATIATNDRVIGAVQVDGVASFANRDVSAAITFPSNIANGTYYVGWKFDALDQVGESSESNNIYGLPSPRLIVVPFKTRVFNPNPVNALNNPSLRACVRSLKMRVRAADMEP